REAKEAAEKARKEAWEEAGRKVREEDIGKLLSVLKSLNTSRTVAKQQLMKEYELSEEDADKKLELY
ncbi:MAG: hypothetical protein NC434_04420, partial [Ruminococcus sp.]|nr:hypothetical protein [Ruminococcus sp.]